MKRGDAILLAHGSGGRLTHELVRDVFLPALDNPALARLSDAAVLEPLPAGRPALTTDAFVVDPPVFPGGDLGYLSVCGTVNDLAVSGARPLWITPTVNRFVMPRYRSDAREVGLPADRVPSPTARSPWSCRLPGGRLRPS